MARKSTRRSPRKRDVKPRKRLKEQFAQRPQESRAWRRFERLHRGHPALKEDTVYALPEGLIDAIKKEIPGFFTPEEEAFERNLAKLSGGGFFLRQPFSHPVMPAPTDIRRTKKEIEMDAHHKHAHHEIEEMLLEELKHSGIADSDLQSANESAAALRMAVKDRAIGYTGWLVTNVDFQKDLDGLLKRWLKTIELIGYFPRVPRSLFGEPLPSVPPSLREFYSDFMAFYNKWGLERMETSDLPVPMYPQLTRPNLYALETVREAGILAFIPFYLLRDNVAQLQDLAKSLASIHAPAPLRRWLKKDNKEWGYARYGPILKLYLFLHLGIEQRYADRVKRRTGKLNDALGTFILKNRVSGGDSIKKARDQIRKLLAKCDAKSE